MINMQGHCSFAKEYLGAQVSGIVAIKPGSEEDLMQAVASVGPISVAIDCVDAVFNYDSGEFWSRK